MSHLRLSPNSIRPPLRLFIIAVFSGLLLGAIASVRANPSHGRTGALLGLLAGAGLSSVVSGTLLYQSSKTHHQDRRESRQRLTAAQSARNALKRDIATLQSHLNETESHLAQAHAARQSAEQTHHQQTTLIKQLESRLLSYETAKGDYEQRISSLLKQLKTLQCGITGRIQQAIQQDRQAQTATLAQERQRQAIILSQLTQKIKALETDLSEWESDFDTRLSVLVTEEAETERARVRSAERIRHQKHLQTIVNKIPIAIRKHAEKQRLKWTQALQEQLDVALSEKQQLSEQLAYHQAEFAGVAADLEASFQVSELEQALQAQVEDLQDALE